MRLSRESWANLAALVQLTPETEKIHIPAKQRLQLVICVTVVPLSNAAGTNTEAKPNGRHVQRQYNICTTDPKLEEWRAKFR